MKHESMVHALEEIRRLLRSDGSLIDTHPILEAPRIEVYQGGKVLFSETAPENADDYEDKWRAEDALAQIVRRRLFVVERSGEYDFLTYGSSAAELLDFLASPSGVHGNARDEAGAAEEIELCARVEKVVQDAGAGVQVAIHERNRIALLRPIP
jgi:hypothetical protein